jgi:hypothetical protein
MSIYATYTATSNYATSTVAASADDSFCYSNGTALCYITAQNARLGYRDGTNYGNCHAGFRFTGLNLPKGATINSAYFYYTDYDTDASTDNILIYGEATSTSQAFVDTNTSIYSAKNRVNTTASTAWTLPNQTDNIRYASPDISSVIQELVNRTDWTVSSPVTILIRNNGATENHNASNYDFSASEVAILYVYYTEASTPTATSDAKIEIITFD